MPVAKSFPLAAIQVNLQVRIVYSECKNRVFILIFLNGNGILFSSRQRDL